MNVQGVHGRRPIHFACLNGHRDVLSVLVAYDVDLTVQDDEGNTPLHTAAIRGNVECAEILCAYALQRGAWRRLKRQNVSWRD